MYRWAREGGKAALPAIRKSVEDTQLWVVRVESGWGAAGVWQTGS